jgi:alginate O-acetyltransferase complex protein AlgI
MLFNSFWFLAFFAVLAVVYYLIPSRYRWILLFAASLYFYATFKPSYLLLLLGVTLVAYWAGLAIGASEDRSKKKAILTVGIVAVLTALFVFKYYGFFIRSLDALLANFGLTISTPLLPRVELVVAAGLSFYTFSCVSYLVDVYNGTLLPERHPGHFALYVAFFPKLLAGPIERAKPFLAQLKQPVSFSSQGVTSGLQQMLWGLFKKVVIADRLGAFVDPVYRQPELSSAGDLVVATYFFAFQLYCDFSGYSDIAIGAAKVLGFDLMENFRRPYLSTSVREFWAHRWHLSLTTWFRDYMYIPMGGSRVSRLRLYFNVMAVFLVSGLWHGANWTFVIWGGLNGLYQVVSLLAGGARRKLAMLVRLPAVVNSFLGGVVTFHLILITWVFFRASSLSDAATIISTVAGSLGTLPAMLRIRLANGEMLVSLALIALLFGVEALDEKRPVWERLRVRPVYQRWAVYYALLFGLIVLGSWKLQQFVYMQF